MDKKTRIRILLIDDFHLCRTFFATALRTESGFEIFEAEPSSEICGIVEKVCPGLIFLNISMMHCSGFSILQSILRCNSGGRVLTYSFLHHGHLHALRAIHAGAAGYIAPDETRESFFKAVSVTMDGGVYLASEIRRRVSVDSKGRVLRIAETFDRLSHREFEVFCLTGRGYVPKMIAEHLKVSVKTVETYRERIREKLGLLDGGELLYHAASFIREQSLPKRV